MAGSVSSYCQDADVVLVGGWDLRRHMFNKETIGKMKKGSWLVNNARGAICDPPAVVEALKSGHLRGVCRTCLAAISLRKPEHSLPATAELQKKRSDAFRAHA